MIVVDTSALVAILADEPEAGALSEVLSRARDIKISTATGVEAFAVAGSRWKSAGTSRLNHLLDAIGVAYQSVDEAQMRLAIDAYATYGRGSGHPAKLNYGDCFSYALARALDAPLLFKGDDFARTDIRPALAA